MIDEKSFKFYKHVHHNECYHCDSCLWSWPSIFPVSGKILLLIIVNALQSGHDAFSSLYYFVYFMSLRIWNGILAIHCNITQADWLMGITLSSVCLCVCASVRHTFYAPGLKGPPGASSNRIVCPSVRLFCPSVHPSVCLSVNSVQLTNKVQYL